MTRPDELREEYHADQPEPGFTIADCLVWGFLIAVAVFLALAFWQAWGAQ